MNLMHYNKQIVLLDETSVCL